MPPISNNESKIKKPARPALTLSRRQLSLLLVGLCIVVAAAAGGYLYYRHVTRNLTTLNSYKLPGSAAGRGMAFNKPARLDADASSTFLPNQAAFNYLIGGHSLGYVAAESSPVKQTNYQASLKQTIKNTSDALNNSKSPNYQLYASLPQLFVKQNTLPIATASYGVAKPFTNSYIKSNAWQFDITITDAKIPNPVQGKLIYALGKNSYYLFIEAAHNKEWQSDKTTWDQILASIKIDQ